MKRVLKKTIAAALTAAMVLSLAPADGAEAAKKPSLSKKKASLVEGKTLKLKVKNGNKKAKVTWKTSKKKIVKITKKSSKGNKATATVKAVKKGSAKITASYKLGKKTTKLVCKVTVKAKGSSNSQQGGSTAATTPPAANATVAPGASAAPGGDAQVSTAPTATDGGQQTPETSEPTVKPTRSPKPPTALPKNSAVEAHKLGKSEEVIVNGKVDKPANGVEWENTTDKEIDLLANKEVSLRGTSDITAAKAFLMWADEADNGENALYAIVKVTKPGTPGSSDKVTLFVSEDGTTVNKAEAVVGATATDSGAAAVSKADDRGGVDGYIAELKVPLSKAYAVDTDKLKIDIMITDGDATINYFDTMTEYELAKDADGNIIVNEDNRNVAVPNGPEVSVDKSAEKMGDVALIASMAAAAKAYYTASGSAIRAIADYENNKWDWEIPAEAAEGEEAETPTDNGIKSKAMAFVPTSFWTSVYEANGDESIAFPNVNDNEGGTGSGYLMDGNITLADKNEDGTWEASRDKVQSYVLWDEGYVYVLFDVTDPSITALGDNDYASDSVEFFLDQDYSAPTSYGEAGTGDEVQFRVVAANNQFAPNDAGTGAYELVAHAVSYKKADGTYADTYDAEGVEGYQVEMIIKLQEDENHKTPKDGDIMGMDLQVNDCYMKYQYEDGQDEFGDPIQVPVEGSGVVTRGGTITAFDTTNNGYQDPSCFGRVKLFAGVQGTPDVPDVPDVEADVEARFTDTAITIDGTAEAAWNAAPYLDVANVVPAAGEGNTSARTKLLWDADNLYVLVSVKDADIDTSSANDYQRDGGEVFLDEDNSKEASYADNTDAFQYRFTGMPEDGSEVATHAIASGSESAKTDYAGIESAYKIVTGSDGAVTGYIIEHKIPWKDKAEIGKVVGFELNVFDCSAGNRNRELYLINTAENPKVGDLWQDPSQMGTLKLVGAVAQLPWTADLSKIQISEEDGSTMEVNDDGSVTIVNGGHAYTGGITLPMPQKWDGTPSKITVYVNTYDADGTLQGGGQFMWNYGDDPISYNWSPERDDEVTLPIDSANLPEFLVMNFQDAGMTWKISKIVVE